MRYVYVMTLIALSGCISSGGPAAPQTPSGRPASSDTLIATLPTFTVAYPKKDWQLSVGVGSSVAVFTHKSRQATVAVETVQMARALAATDITDQTATLESEAWRERRPNASGLSHRVVDTNGQRIIVSEFAQAGTQGRERVRLYTLPHGTTWYRVVCTAAESAFDQYQDTCQRMALSLTPTSAAQ